MSTRMNQRLWILGGVVLLFLAMAALGGVAGCGGEDESVAPPYDGGYTPTTAAPATTTTYGSAATTYGSAEYSASEGGTAGDASGWGTDVALAGTLTALESASGQKIISDAQVEIEVEAGKFQTVFDQAMLLADKYGGYLVNSSSYASGEEDSMKSGTVAIRVPSTSFTQALSDVGKLGTLKNQSLSTQDVTEEFVDLEARIKNAEANVQSLISLLEKAETVDEILYVRSVLNTAQDDLESLKGRMRYLEEHTSYSTITMSIYETGVEVTSVESWGFVDAVKDGLRNLVKAFNAIIRGLGILVPILIVVGIVAYIVYLIVRAISRRNKQRQQAYYQAHPEYGWQQPGRTGGAQPYGPAGSPAEAGAQPAQPSQAAPVPESDRQAGAGQAPNEPGGTDKKS